MDGRRCPRWLGYDDVQIFIVPRKRENCSVSTGFLAIQAILAIPKVRLEGRGHSVSLDESVRRRPRADGERRIGHHVWRRLMLTGSPFDHMASQTSSLTKARPALRYLQHTEIALCRSRYRMTLPRAAWRASKLSGKISCVPSQRTTSWSLGADQHLVDRHLPRKKSQDSPIRRTVTLLG